MRHWIWILVVVCALGWLASPTHYRVHEHAPGVLAPDTPEQHDLDHAQPFTVGEYSITPLADFSLTARVLSRADYHFDRESALSPTDLAFGWGRMSDSAVIAQFDISQSGRWYYYRWRTSEPPIPLDEIIRSSANMHMIPADDMVRTELKQVHPGDIVHLEGQLIEDRKSVV